MVVLMSMMSMLVLDILTKYIVITHMYVGESIPVLAGYMNFTYILNRGAAFGMLENQHVLFLGIVCLICGLSVWKRREISLWPLYAQMGLGLLLGGALGNAFDRVRQGAVIDFFDFKIWPIFNVADVGICLGVALLALYTWQYENRKKDDGI